MRSCVSVVINVNLYCGNCDSVLSSVNTVYLQVSPDRTDKAGDRVPPSDGELHRPEDSTDCT